MRFYDKTLRCRDCGREFIWSDRDQEFFASKELNQPSRCRECRSKRNPNNNKHWHEENILRVVSCIDCGTDVKVTKLMEQVKEIRCKQCYETFKSRPVYEVICNECGHTKRRTMPHPNPDRYLCRDCIAKRESELYTISCDGPGCEEKLKVKHLPDPGRPFYCRDCLQAGNRIMYDVICNNCLTDFEVPFDPDPTRPIYCQDCKDERDLRRLVGGSNTCRQDHRHEEYREVTRESVWNYNVGGCGPINKGGEITTEYPCCA